MEAKKCYEKRMNRYERLLAAYTRTANLISNLRLAVFLAGAAVSVTLLVLKLFYLGAASLTASTVLFVWLVIKHGRVLEMKKYSMLLIKINESALKRLKGEWLDFADKGEEFKDEGHNFSYDLDLFGDGSLFQMISNANTFLGRTKLRDILISPPKDKSEIQKRQEAVKELASKLKWRQRFSAEGMMTSERMRDPADLLNWAGERMDFFRKPWVIVVIRVLPVITLCLMLSTFIFHLTPFYCPIPTLLLQYVLLRIRRKECSRIFSRSAGYREDIKVYYKMLKIFEKEKFSSPLIVEMKAGLQNIDGLDASRQIDRLSKIVDSTSQRYNAFYYIFNLFTLWDFQNLIALEKWKEKSGSRIEAWLNSIAETETLCSLAVLGFEHPDWVMPELTDEKALYDANDMGHPLLVESGVHNDLKIDVPVKVLMITGSNMSGKSTFLRTAGINLVLAYSGAPVCAKTFKVSIMEIFTCMRVSDNLGKNISSFYAELIRIKAIVNATAENKKIFFLLDEIFKGTNSKDRHTGAKVLIDRLSATDSIGMVSTHDLELSEMELDNSRIKNYHFREYYENNEIRFDYKLRPGASTTRNAVYLMKMAGIEIEDGKS